MQLVARVCRSSLLMWRSPVVRSAAKAAGGLCCRVVIVPCMGLTVTAGAQGLYLMSLYRPLPEVRGPMKPMCTARAHRSQSLAAAAH